MKTELARKTESPYLAADTSIAPHQRAAYPGPSSASLCDGVQAIAKASTYSV